jgi:hypothetical protein
MIGLHKPWNSTFINEDYLNDQCPSMRKMAYHSEYNQGKLLELQSFSDVFAAHFL